MTFAARLVAMLAAAILLCAQTAFAQGDYYRGRTITLVISSSSGGGYDIMGRTLARYLPKHIPGNPRVIVTNMPGAGGIVAAGESGVIVAAPAVVSAIENALEPFGVHIAQIPVPPQKLLELIARGRSAPAR